MATKRERDLQRAREVRAIARTSEVRRRRLLLAAIVAAVVVVIAAIGAFAVSGSDDDGASKSPSPSATGKPAEGCIPTGELQTEAQQFPDGPDIDELPAGEFGLKLGTNCGTIEIMFDAENAPKNAASMVFLANTGADGEQGYFDNTTCHRLTSEGIFVLQCGDPTGTGSGSPGYTTVDEGLERTAETFEPSGAGGVIYPRGTVAMANSGANTAGSQFFLVYKDSQLAPAYTVIGEVTEGLDIIDKIAEGGSTPPGDGAPKSPLELVKVNSFERRTSGN